MQSGYKPNLGLWLDEMHDKYEVKLAELYNVEYANMPCKVYSYVQCRVCRDVAIPDGIRLHLGMEILSLTTHLAQWPNSGERQEAVFSSGILVF